MENILDQVGEHLAQRVQQYKLPTTSLEIENIQGKWLIPDHLLNLLSNNFVKMIILVGDDPAFLQAYINSLAVLLNKPDDLAPLIEQVIQRHHQRGLFAEPGFGHGLFEELAKKQIWTLDIEKLLALSSNNLSEWHKTWDVLLWELQRNDYVVYLNNLAHLLDRERLTLPDRQRLGQEWQIKFMRFRSMVTLSWHDYVTTMENSTFPLFPRYTKTILFSPRPENLPKYTSLVRGLPD